VRQLTEDDIDEYMSGWNFFDKNLTGYIDQSLVKSLLKSLRPPLGLPQDTTNAEFIRFCCKLNIKARNGKVHYQELIVMLHRIACNPGQPVSEEVLRRNKLTDRHIHRKIQLSQEKVERGMTVARPPPPSPPSSPASSALPSSDNTTHNPLDHGEAPRLAGRLTRHTSSGSVLRSFRQPRDADDGKEQERGGKGKGKGSGSGSGSGRVVQIRSVDALGGSRVKKARSMVNKVGSMLRVPIGRARSEERRRKELVTEVAKAAGPEPTLAQVMANEVIKVKVQRWVQRYRAEKLKRHAVNAAVLVAVRRFSAAGGSDSDSDSDSDGDGRDDEGGDSEGKNGGGNGDVGGVGGGDIGGDIDGDGGAGETKAASGGGTVVVGSSSDHRGAGKKGKGTDGSYGLGGVGGVDGVDGIDGIGVIDRVDMSDSSSDGDGGGNTSSDGSDEDDDTNASTRTLGGVDLHQKVLSVTEVAVVRETMRRMGTEEREKEKERIETDSVVHLSARALLRRSSSARFRQQEPSGVTEGGVMRPDPRYMEGGMTRPDPRYMADLESAAKSGALSHSIASPEALKTDLSLEDELASPMSSDGGSASSRRGVGGRRTSLLVRTMSSPSMSRGGGWGGEWGGSGGGSAGGGGSSGGSRVGESESEDGENGSSGGESEGGGGGKTGAGKRQEKVLRRSSSGRVRRKSFVS
jgi:hypothetical protein